MTLKLCIRNSYSSCKLPGRFIKGKHQTLLIRKASSQHWIVYLNSYFIASHWVIWVNWVICRFCWDMHLHGPQHNSTLCLCWANDPFKFCIFTHCQSQQTQDVEPMLAQCCTLCQHCASMDSTFLFAGIHCVMWGWGEHVSHPDVFSVNFITDVCLPRIWSLKPSTRNLKISFYVTFWTPGPLLTRLHGIRCNSFNDKTPRITFWTPGPHIACRHIEWPFDPCFITLLFLQNIWVRILEQVTINRRLLIGRDGHLDQSEAYDLS